MILKMIKRTRDSIEKDDATNVEFRLGEIEHLPVADETTDIAISNCVVNLSPAKRQFFPEAFRALVPGGELAVSNVVLIASLPETITDDLDSLAGCIAGASTVEAIEKRLDDVGFVDIRVRSDNNSADFISEWDNGHNLSEYVVPAAIKSKKPTVERA